MLGVDTERIVAVMTDVPRAGVGVIEKLERESVRRVHLVVDHDLAVSPCRARPYPAFGIGVEAKMTTEKDEVFRILSAAHVRAESG